MLLDLYKKAFLTNYEAKYWGGETYIRTWDDTTMYLYCFIVLTTLVLGLYIENKKHYYEFHNTFVVERKINLLSLILLFIMGFRGLWVGVDTIVYSQIPSETTKLSLFNGDGGTEPLFNLFSYFLGFLFPNQHVIIFIYSFIIITLLFSTLKKYYQEVSFIISALAFVCIYYFQSFNLVRIFIAASFLVWSFPLLVSWNLKQYSFRILISSLIHYSSVVMFLPIGLIYLYKKRRSYALIVAMIIVFLIFVSLDYFNDYISLINRYSRYVGNNESTGRVGYALLFDYLPCIYLCYYVYSKKIRNQWADLLVCFTISALIIRLLAYFISMSGRLSIHFMVLNVLLLPYWVYYLKIHDKAKYKIVLSFCVIWILIKVHLYFLEYLVSDGIMPYYFFWNE